MSWRGVVGDPYAGGYGAFDQANPWVLAEDALLDQEWEERLSGGGQDDAV